MLRFSCFLILHESQQMDFCLSGCAVHFSRRKAEISVSGRCLEAVLASSGQTQETAWGGAAGWAVPSPTPQLQAQTRQGGRALCCESLWAHQGMVQASHLYCVGCHLCWLPRQNFLSCWQSCTRVETRHLHQWKALSDAWKQSSGSDCSDVVWLCDFSEEGTICFFPSYHTSMQRVSISAHQTWCCSLWAAWLKNRERAAGSEASIHCSPLKLIFPQGCVPAFPLFHLLKKLDQ